MCRRRSDSLIEGLAPENCSKDVYNVAVRLLSRRVGRSELERRQNGPCFTVEGLPRKPRLDRRRTLGLPIQARAGEEEGAVSGALRLHSIHYLLKVSVYCGHSPATPRGGAFRIVFWRFESRQAPRTISARPFLKEELLITSSNKTERCHDQGVSQAEQPGKTGRRTGRRDKKGNI
jgi:hypothetical protein